MLLELRRIRKLLELEDDAYSDLMVMQRARMELQEIAADDEYEEAAEDDLEDEP